MNKKVGVGTIIAVVLLAAVFGTSAEATRTTTQIGFGGIVDPGEDTNTWPKLQEYKNTNTTKTPLLWEYNTTDTKSKMSGYGGKKTTNDSKMLWWETDNEPQEDTMPSWW